MTKYLFEKISEWVTEYKLNLSFSETARLFNIEKTTIHRILNKYKQQLNLKFKEEVQEELFKQNKRLCLPVTGCGKIKDLDCFQFRNDSQKYKEQCKECRSEYCKQWVQNNIEYVKDKNRIYGQIHRDEITERDRLRRQSDVNFRLTKLLRSRLRHALKGHVKHGSAVNDLGCSIEFLKEYFELKFYPHPETNEAMSWENLGKWHIDHVVPLISFNLSDKEQFLKACNYTNLQPLWAEENLKKSDKI